jgi:hypothetical protein
MIYLANWLIDCEMTIDVQYRLQSHLRIGSVYGELLDLDCSSN